MCKCTRITGTNSTERMSKEETPPETTSSPIEIIEEEGDGEPTIPVSTYNFKDLKKEFKNKCLDSNYCYLVAEYPIDEPFFGVRLSSNANADSIFAINYFETLNHDVDAGDDIPFYICTDGKVIKKNLIYPDSVADKCKIIMNLIPYKNYLLLVLGRDIVFYDKNTLKQVNKVRYEDLIGDEFKIINGRFFIYRCSAGLGAASEKPFISELDPNTLKLKKIYKFNNPKGANLTFMSKDFMGVWKQGFFISDITRYRIKFFDFNMKLISEINYLPDNWVTNKSIADTIDQYRDFDQIRRDFKRFNAISNIEKIKFIDDSTFILERADPKISHKNKGSDHYVDIWRLSEGKWKLLYASMLKNTDLSYKINGKYSAFYGNPTFSTNRHFFVSSALTLNILKDSLLYNGTYQDILDKVLKTREDGILPTSSSIKVFKVKEL